MPGSLICQSKQLEVSVQDRGVGIPQSEIGHIFEPFYSQQSAGGLKRPGHGIGLSICRNICEKLGGSITVNSLENFGALADVVGVVLQLSRSIECCTAVGNFLAI